MSISVVNRFGGIILQPSVSGLAGAISPSPYIEFDPDDWVVSLFRSLESYVKGNVPTDIYEIEFSFPSADDLGRWMPLDKTLIHFEIDDIRWVAFGFGDNVVDVLHDDIDKTVIEHEANIHVINFDVGIWASKRSGGVTARLRAYQKLNDLFAGPSAFEALQSLGIEIQQPLQGGNFIKEEIDDISVFRVMDMNLSLRVYSRKIKTPIPYIDDIALNPQLYSPDEIIIVE